jgi:hypothetical protein
VVGWRQFDQIRSSMAESWPLLKLPISISLLAASRRVPLPIVHKHRDLTKEEDLAGKNELSQVTSQAWL